MTYLEEVANEIRQEIPEDELPDSDVDSLFLLYAVLCLAKGSEVSSRDVHDAWSAWMTLRGEEHPSLVPYDQLPPQVRAEDNPFALAIRRVAKRRAEK